MVRSVTRLLLNLGRGRLSGGNKRNKKETDPWKSVKSVGLVDELAVAVAERLVRERSWVMARTARTVPAL